MEKIKWIKKGISALLALNMVLLSVPLSAFAAEEDNLCEHHPVHTAECHYEAVAGSPCTHTHSEDCYSILSCIHEHEEETCGVDNVDCTHECTVDNGCITMERDCHHVHGDCGYSEGAAEVPCGHVHDETCGYVEVVYEVLCGCTEMDEGGNLIHTEGCGYVAPVEGVACGHTEHTDCGYAPATEGTPCTHVCEVKVNSADSCYKLLCSHADGGHDEACGYVAAMEGQDCSFVCTECTAEPASEPDEPTVDESVSAVQAMIDSLPTPDSYLAMDADNQNASQDLLMAAYEAFTALTTEQQAKIDTTAMYALQEAVMNGGETLEEVTAPSTTNIDGVDYYQIATADDLLWFAEFVKSGNSGANAVLTNNIDLNGATWTPIAQTPSYHTSAVTDTGYTGTFDGAGHIVSDFEVECEAGNGESDATGNVKSYGLFGTVSGTVKNLGVSGFYFDATASGKADCRAGGIAGQVLTGGRIENCFTVNSSILTGSRIAGGIAGCNYGGTIENCFAYNNTVTGHSRCAAIVGDTVTDSGAPTKLIGYVTNCYADKAPVGSQNGGDTYITSCEQKSAEQFRSGEVAFLLGEAWGQTPGEGLPVLGGEPVKQASDGTYYNDIIQVTIVWTSMEFTYGETWNPETLQYEESWTASGDGAVTVTNEGTMAVNAEFAYEQKYKPVTGSFTEQNLALPPKETETTQLLLSGKPGEDLENQELGTITVTIHRATN